MLDHLSFYRPYFLFRRAPPGLSTVQGCFFGLVKQKLCATIPKIILVIKNKGKKRQREQYSTACYVVVHSHKEG